MTSTRFLSTLTAPLAALGLAVLCTTSCKRPQADRGEEPTKSTSTAAEGGPADESSESERGRSPGERGRSPGERAESARADCALPEFAGIRAEDIAGGETFDKPLYVTQPPGHSDTLYVVERAGRILRVRDGEILDEPFLDFRDRVETSHRERGLLGLAFHPDYPENRRFFLFYTPAGEHKNVVAEYRRSEDGPTAAPEELRRLVEIEDPEDNHNGGMLTFGPDGYLYAGMGDGGGAGDRHGEIGNGLNRETLLGSILRLDVDAPERDFAPTDNPFAGDGAEGADQIWAWGLRNPWRFSFDSKTGDLYIGDVGQDKYEEIAVERADSDGGENYGWRAYEADDVYDESLIDRVDDHSGPAVSVRQGLDEGPVRNACSITGGYVYRGDSIDRLRGVYLYGDFCSNDVAAFRYCDGELAGPRRVPGLTKIAKGLASFGRDNAGELYLVYHDSGHVKRVVAN